MTASDAITSIYPQWMQAVQDKDVATLDRIVGSEFRYTDNIQGHKNRDAWMEAACVYDIISFEFTSIEVVDYGLMAVAFVKYRQSASLRGVSRAGDWLITDLWSRSGNGYQVVARSAILRST